jgi:uncharacterized membrane protein
MRAFFIHIQCEPEEVEGKRMEVIFKHLKGTFFAGIFIIIPFGITVFILKFLFNFADGILGSHLDSLMVFFGRSEGHIPGIGMITGAVVIYLTGLVGIGICFFDLSENTSSAG